jgi:hypothetical protein
VSLSTLKNYKDSKGEIPDDNKTAEYKLLVGDEHPLLKNAYCVFDGLKIKIQ